MKLKIKGREGTTLQAHDPYTSIPFVALDIEFESPTEDRTNVLLDLTAKQAKKLGKRLVELAEGAKGRAG